MNNSKYTLDFLNAISSRLSSRDDCRNDEYLVRIRNNIVQMTPVIYVFPDRYKRKESDKRTIIEFVQSRLKCVSANLDLIDGTYKYEKSVNGKRRRWTKEDI